MRYSFTLTAAALLTLLVSSGRADELADKGRQILTKNAHTVVTVQVDMKLTYSMAGRSSAPNESKQDVTGTVVDPSGLTVLSLSTCDPTSMYETLVAGVGEGGQRAKMEAELISLKIMLDDGNELPAEIVLRDKDLDLAFIRPKTKPARPMPAVDLSKSTPVQVLDQVITLNRLGKAAGRAYAVSVERVSAVLQKPRLFYVPDSAMTTTALGSPAFAPNGDVVGIFLIRAVSATSGASLSSLRQDSVTSIILPAEDVLKAARQAPEAKGGDEKKEAPKDTKAAAEK